MKKKKRPTITPLPYLTSKRIVWGGAYRNLPPLNLLEVQKESYRWFLSEGIKQGLAEISPIDDYTGKNWRLIFGKFFFDKPKYTASTAQRKGLTYDQSLKVEAILLDKKNGKRKVKQEVFIGDFPIMTQRASFIINGIERVVVNQLVRSPGVFFRGEVDPISGKMFYSAELRPMRGSWLEFSVGKKNIISVRIDRRRKFPATILLRAFGLSSNKEIVERFKQIDSKKDRFIHNTLEKDPSADTHEAILEVFKKIRPGEPLLLENAKELIENTFFNPRRYDLSKVGRFKINKKLGLAVSTEAKGLILSLEDIVATLFYLIKLQRGIGGRVDDIDHLANRRVRRVGELVYTAAFRLGLLRLERMVKEKMSLITSQNRLTPNQLVNARPIMALINDFFRTSQLSTILDQTNLLSEIDNLRRLTVMGSGGISRERASFSIRDINASQYGRICPVRSPEGPNIGLVTYMALYTRVNEYGFLETPYRKVKKVITNGGVKMQVTDEIVYLAADDEQEHYITHAEIKIDKQGFLQDEIVPVRYQGEFLESPLEKVEYIDVVPRQVFGTSASLIPFLSHDEANRALMGTHMQCQAVPLINPQAPLIATGMEAVVPEEMGRLVRATRGGRAIYVDGNKVIIKTEQRENDVYRIEKFVRTTQSTCFSQKPLVKVGQKVKKGDLIIDAPASQNGELALGQNLLIAYMSYQGLGYEDAIVISDRLVKQDLLTSINIEEYETAVMDTKLGPEEITADIPNVGEADLANLDKDGIVVVGSEVGPNSILVGKIAPKGETELSAEERLLRAIFGEKAREVRDTSLRIPHGERGIVVDIQILDRAKGDELEPGTLKIIKVKVAQMRKVVCGDKLAGRHGNKGVISKIVPAADMPYLEDGTPVDIIISSLSVLTRMNLGQLLEIHLGWAAHKLGLKLAVPVFEKVSEDKIINLLQKAKLPRDGKVVVYDGRTGLPFDQRVAVGIAYILKLTHMVEDKTHARSTGPYSLVTQQPLGGKAQMGGQRLGEMEVWALEAHRAAYTLQEMLTIKSDDVVGRAKAFEAIVKGVDIPQALIPESFKVLVKELNSLGLNVIPLGSVISDSTDDSQLSDEELKQKALVAKKARELAKAAGSTTYHE